MSTWIHATNLVKTASTIRDTGIAGGIEARSADSGVPLPIFIPENGELRRFSYVVGERDGVDGSEIEGQQVKRGPQVVKAVSDEQSEGACRDLRGNSNEA